MSCRYVRTNVCRRLGLRLFFTNLVRSCRVSIPAAIRWTGLFVVRGALICTSQQLFNLDRHFQIQYYIYIGYIYIRF